MAIVAETYSFVIGVDTHARTHTFVSLQSLTSAVLATATFPATATGTRRAMDWVGRRTGGDTDTLVVVEGIGFLRCAGRQVGQAGRLPGGRAGARRARPAPRSRQER